MIGRLGAAVAVVLGALALAAAPAGAQPRGSVTVNLRTCVDAGDGACLTTGDTVVDGVTVCLRGPHLAERCASTEDGEFWIDSLASGPYWARVVEPGGYELATATCTTHPNLAYRPCRSSGDEVHFVAHQDANAVNVNFLLTPA